MDTIRDLFLTNPAWMWLSVGAVLLAVEVGTGTGWLLWPAASAGILAILLLLGMDIGWTGDLIVFAGLTLVSTVVSHQVLRGKRPAGEGPDINDRNSNLLGKTGHVVSNNRVMVDGAEWEIESDDGSALAPGTKVQVVRVPDGAKLTVRAL